MSVIRVKSANLLRRDTAANWQIKNPILRKGEQGLETDTGIMKIGDGTTEYNSLSDDNIYLPKSHIKKEVVELIRKIQTEGEKQIAQSNYSAETPDSVEVIK